MFDTFCSARFSVLYCDFYRHAVHVHQVFFYSFYGAPLAKRASYLALHSSLFGPDGTVNYDYINSLLIGIPIGTHTLTIVEPIWSMLQNVYVYVHVISPLISRA